MREWLTGRRAAGIAAALLAVVVIVLGRVHDHGGPPPRPVAAAPTVTPSPSAAPPPAAQPQAVSVAVAFTRAWLHQAPPRRWLAAVTPYATTRLARLLAYTDPANLPRATVEPGVATRLAALDSAIYVLGLSDGSHVAVTVVRAAGRWQVSTIAPAQAGNA